MSVQAGWEVVMRRAVSVFFALGLIAAASFTAEAQADEFCREYGEAPGREFGRDNRLVPFVFGRIIVNGAAAGRPPRIVVIYSDSLQPATRQVIGRSGSYCFPKRGSGGLLVIEMDGIEAARKPVSDVSTKGQREDFELFAPSATTTAPGVVDVRFSRPPNEKTIDLYKKAAEAESDKKPEKAIELLRSIVSIDGEDFIAWTKLGSLLAAAGRPDEAAEAFTSALTIRKDYTPALLTLGTIYGLKGEMNKAIEMFERAVVSDPRSARAFRLLGEAYLQSRQGSRGLLALDEALRLDPIGMAECHLLKARLYDLAGARNLAAAEYKEFLKKVSDHPDRKKFEKYVKENEGS